jgi:hypothetical protein
MGDTQYKSIMGDVAIKSESKGEVEAVFARLNVIDHDGDVTVPGAFKEGQTVAISQHGHTIWDGTAPVGKGTIHTVGDTAVFRGKFFMDMQAARDTFHAVKGMAEHGQWSYGFNTLTAEPGQLGGKDVKFLKELEVFEVSPVLRGAGIGTMTTSAKQRSDTNSDSERGSAVAALWKAISTHETPTTTKRWSATDLKGSTIDELRAKHAAVDAAMDPDDPAAYAFEHHDETGAASVRQCLLGIARLNGAKGGPSLPDAVRKSVYDHLADHLRDGDRDAPDLRDMSASLDSLKFYDHLLVTLADVQMTNARSHEVVALRSKRREASRRNTKASERAPASVLSPVSVDLLDWLHDELRQLKALVDTPQEDLERERIRFIREEFLRTTNPGE